MLSVEPLDPWRWRQTLQLRRMFVRLDRQRKRRVLFRLLVPQQPREQPPKRQHDDGDATREGRDEGENRFGVHVGSFVADARVMKSARLGGHVTHGGTPPANAGRMWG